MPRHQLNRADWEMLSMRRGLLFRAEAVKAEKAGVTGAVGWRSRHSRQKALSLLGLLLL